MLVVIGYLYFMFYTAAGMVILPINMIRSRGRTTKDDQEMIDEQRRNNDDTTKKISKKYTGRKTKNMSARDRRKLQQVKNDERTINKASKRAKETENGVCGKIQSLLRPFEFLFGIVFFLLSLFLAVSLLMTTTDKLMQVVKSGDYKTGYSKTTANIVNPVDILFTKASIVFPLDYVIVTLIVYYFIMATIAGVKYFGVRFLHLKMYKIRVQRTVPQGLLFLSFILMFTILCLNVVLMTLSPQYVTYGNQHFTRGISSEASESGGLYKVGVAEYPSKHAGTTTVGASLEICSSDAPGALYLLKNSKSSWLVDVPFTCEESPCSALDCQKALMDNAMTEKVIVSDSFVKATNNRDSTTMAQFISDNTITKCSIVESPCVQTRLAALLRSFFFQFWFLGAIYYWANWGFLLIFFLSLIVITCKRRRSLMQAMINDVNEDVDDSDDDMMPFSPSWA